MGNPQQYNPTPKKVLSEEERKNLSRRRIYWAIIVLDAALACLFLYEIFDLFLYR